MSKRLILVLAATAAFILLFFGACRLERPARAPVVPPVALRGPLALPAGVTVDYERTHVVAHFEGAAEYTRTTGSAAWGDTYLYWRHPDPAQVDYYEVYTTTNQPYFSVPVSATLVLTTTAQGAVFYEAPARFNPVPQSGASMVSSAYNFYAIRAINTAGAAESSTVLGVVQFSLIGPPYDWTTNPAGMPTPKPTAGPSPTPVPTATLTPVPAGTPGPSPTP